MRTLVFIGVTCVGMLAVVACERQGPQADIAPGANTAATTAEPNDAGQSSKHTKVDAWFKQRFDMELRDEPWASERETKLRTILNGLDAVSVTSAECRETVCEVKLAFDTNAVLSTFSDNLSRQASDLFPPNGVGHLFIPSPSTKTARMWMTREGYGNPGPNGKKGQYSPPGPAHPEVPGAGVLDSGT